jgi:hypothetical protein
MAKTGSQRQERKEEGERNKEKEEWLVASS